MKNKQTYTPFEQSLLNASHETVALENGGLTTIVSFLLLPKSMPIFIGHFPGQPIFPAVLQLTLVRLLCSETMQKKLHNLSVGKTKFSSMIQPDEKIKVEIELSENENEYNAKFKFFNPESLASTGTVKYRVDNLNGTA